jgi:glycosyltransferase involved in cell wall biosynthesis
LAGISSDGADGRGPILHVLPRGMNFSLEKASSIDLFVSEVAAASRMPIEIVAEANDPPLPAAKLHSLPSYPLAQTFFRARYVAALARRLAPRLIVVQQHLPSAAAIAARVNVPVLLQRHNFMRAPKGGFFGGRHVRALNSLAGVTFVSEAAREEFTRDWQVVTIPRWVVPNGVDVKAWRPERARGKFVIVVGRATPEKGLLEAAQALALALAREEAWSTTFVVAGAARGAAYLAEVRVALSPLGGRAEVLTDVPFAAVKALNESAAIALVPSKWREPFGRTCLEAHAGGAAVISSGSGGLREISGEAALYVPGADAAGLARAVATLVADEALRVRLAAEGRARAENLFDLSRVAARLDDACEAVMRGAR